MINDNIINAYRCPSTDVYHVPAGRTRTPSALHVAQGDRDPAAGRLRFTTMCVKRVLSLPSIEARRLLLLPSPLLLSQNETGFYRFSVFSRCTTRLVNNVLAATAAVVEIRRRHVMRTRGLDSSMRLAARSGLKYDFGRTNLFFTA